MVSYRGTSRSSFQTWGGPKQEKHDLEHDEHDFYDQVHVFFPVNSTSNRCHSLQYDSCNRVHLHIVFALLYSVCRSVSVLVCVDVIQSFMYVLRVVI